MDLSIFASSFTFALVLISTSEATVRLSEYNGPVPVTVTPRPPDTVYPKKFDFIWKFTTRELRFHVRMNGNALSQMRQDKRTGLLFRTIPIETKIATS